MQGQSQKDGWMDGCINTRREKLKVGGQQRPRWASKEKKGQTVSVT